MAGVGMKIYNDILQSARETGKPIGPKHHLVNKQLRVWESKIQNRQQLSKAREVKKVKGEVRKARVNISAALERINSKAKEVNQADALRERYNALARKKISDGLKGPEWQDTHKIKSVGNGL